MKIPNLTPEQVAEVLGEPLTSDDYEAAANVYGEACDVCDGTGLYLVKNIYGEQVFLIDCPACGGEP
jgi:excinuclease UvrABC ATPase subunit